VPFSPLARQFLTGKCHDVRTVTEDDIRASIARPRFEPENFAQNEKLLIPLGKK
jgi:aryl-alcohol dehydrogenase-like predicted oxidoreductase